MTIVEFPQKKDPESVLDFLDTAKKVMADSKPHAIVLISYHKADDGDAIGIGIGGKEISTIELLGLLSMVKSEVEFGENMSGLGD